MRAVASSALPGPAGSGGSPSPRLGEVPEPDPSPGEVLLDIRATAINRADLLQLRGLYPPPPGETDVPGLECAGVVARVGEGVEAWEPGDRVMALLAGGGHAERVAVPAGQLIRLPDRLTFIQGAALPESCITAWTNLVVEGELRAGQSVLITGANGGVGTIAVQVAAALGGRVVAAGRRLERMEPLRSLGAEALMVEGEELPSAVRDWSEGRGVDLVFDLVGGDHLDSHLGALRNRGRLVLVGVIAGARPRVDLAAILRRRLTIVGSVLRARSREEKARLVADFTGFARELLADGRIRPVVDRVVPFERIADAYAALEAGGVTGKVVVSLGS